MCRDKESRGDRDQQDGWERLFYIAWSGKAPMMEII